MTGHIKFGDIVTDLPIPGEMVLAAQLSPKSMGHRPSRRRRDDAAEAEMICSRTDIPLASCAYHIA